MIAQQPANVRQEPRFSDPSHVEEPFSLQRIVATLQVVLAARRAAHSDEHAYWYAIARGM